MIYVNKIELLNVFKTMEKIKIKNKSLPTLENTHISVIDNKMTIYKTNFEFYFVETVNIINNDNISVDFSISVDKSLIDRLDFIDDNNIKIECFDTYILIADTIKMQIMDTIKIPTILLNNFCFNIDKKILLEKINGVRVAAAKTAEKPVLTCLHFNNNNIVCCDGYRIHQTTLNINNIYDNFNINAELASKYLKFFDNTSLDVYQDNKYVIFKTETQHFLIRKVVIDFIKYKEVFKDYKDNNYIEIKDIKTFIKKVKIFEKKKYIIFENNMIYEGNDKNNNIQNEFEISIKIAFNPKYLLDGLNQHKKADSLKIYYSKPLSGFILTSNNESSLVLPVRI